MTWTRFNSEGHSPINFSQSTDGGATWSTRAEISGSNGAICTVPVVGPCNDDQGSNPLSALMGRSTSRSQTATSPAPGRSRSCS